MKKVFAFFCILLLVGCANVETEQINDNLDSANLDEFLSKVNLPKNFKLDFGVELVSEKTSANRYYASIFSVSEEKAIRTLLGDEELSTQVYALGPQFELIDESSQQYLTIYDGGKSFGVDSGVHGGLNYSYFVGGNDIYPTVISMMSGYRDETEQLLNYKDKTDYQSSADLAFTTYENALLKLEIIFEEIGLPDLDVTETYSLDLETMKKHYDAYKKDVTKIGDHLIEYQFSKEDEAYLFFLRQIIDDIPLSNVYWQSEIAEMNEIYSTSVDALVNKKGITSMSANNLLDVKEKIEEHELINKVTSLKKLIEHYSNTLMMDETKVISMELSYVAIHIEENKYELIPAWIYCISSNDVKVDPVTEEEIEFNTYDYFVQNAITGEQIKNARAVK